MNMRTTSTLSLHSDPPPPFPSDDPTSSSSSSHPIVYDVKSDLTQFSSPFPFPILTQLAQLFAQVDTLGLGTLAYHQLTYCIDVCLRHLQSIYVTHPIPSQTEMDQLLFSHMPDFMHLREEQRITFEQVHKILCTCVVLPSSTSPPRSPISFRQNVPSIPPLSPTSHVSVPIPSPRPSHSTSPVPTSLHSKRSPSSDFTTLKRPRFIPFILGIHVILMLSMLIWQRHWAWTHLNPMLGPTPQTLITWGATYVPCMRPNEMVSLKLSELETMCSWSAFLTGKPDQLFRLVTSLVVPSGLIPLLITVGVGMFLGFPLERKWGWRSMAFIYALSGLTGLVYSSLFSPNTIKTGLLASSSGLFGLFYVHPWLYPTPFTPSKKSWKSLGQAWCMMFCIITLFLLDKVHAITGFLSGCVLSGCVLTGPRWLRCMCGLVWVLSMVGGIYVFFTLKDAWLCPWCKWMGNIATIELPLS